MIAIHRKSSILTIPTRATSAGFYAEWQGRRGPRARGPARERRPRHIAGPRPSRPEILRRSPLWRRRPPRAPPPSRWPTRATSSVGSPHNSATGARCCWAKSSTPKGRRLRPAPQGLWPHAVLARRRRQGGAGPRVLREYLMGEAMHALGIPTTRALGRHNHGRKRRAATARNRARCWPASPQAHLRVGTFQFFAARNDWDKVRQLANYAIARHDPDLVDAPTTHTWPS